MHCFYHSNRAATSVCNNCGKALCTECGQRFQPPTCLECAEEHINAVKAEMKKSIVLSVLFAIFGMVLCVAVYKGAVGLLFGICLGGIPTGWKTLNKITPAMFLWLPLVGWIIYFFIKLSLSCTIGVYTFPYSIYKWVKTSKETKNLQELVDAARS